MASEDLDPNQEELDAQEPSEQEPQQPGLASTAANAAGREVVKRGAASLAKGGLAAGAQAAGAAAGGPAGIIAARAATALASPILPGILVLILIFLTLGAVLMIGFAICVSNGCMGTAAFEQKLELGNKQDALDVKTAQCLDEVAGDKDGKGTVPQKCIEPIQAYSQSSIDMANNMLPKVPDPSSGAGQEATKLLNELLAAATEAHTVTTATTLDVARTQRKKMVDALVAANANPIIQKLQGFSANAQKIIDYVNAQPKGVCRQTTSFNCGDTADSLILANFPGATVSSYSAFGGLVDGLPTDKNIQDVRDQLTKGNIPVWHIRGSASGKHFIVVLGINANKNITYFDPANGAIETNSYDWPGTGGHTYFFGTPTLENIGSNQRIRGYYFTPTK